MAVPPSDRQRRCSTEMMLTALTSGLAAVREPRLVRERFEETLRAFLGAASVTFCEEGEAPERPHILSCELPALPMEGRPCLVAVFDSKRPVDDRARQMLASASQVAGLLLELERANGRWPVSSTRGRADGAAPLIGSSLPIRAVRERIERVASTDFTILIEGGFGPEPHFRTATANKK